MLLIDILRNKNMLRKITSDLINFLNTTDQKTVLKYIKAINQVSDNPLKSKDLKIIVRTEIRKNKTENRLANKNNPLEIVSSNYLLSSDFKTEWIIQGLLPKGSLSILSARPGRFKTWLTLYFAICISQGKSVFGMFPVKKSKVLIINEEDSNVLIKERLITLGLDKKTEISFSIMSGFKADNDENIELLIKEVKRLKIDVVIIDSLVRIHSGDENSAKDMSNLFCKISRLKKLGITVLINHHHRKGQGEQDNDNQSMRGSVDILAALDCHMMISKEGNDLKIKQTKNRYQPEIPPFKISFVKEDYKMEFIFKEYTNGSSNVVIDKQEKNKVSILSFIEQGVEPITQDIIYREFQGSIGKNNILNILKILEDEQKIKTITKDKNRKLYVKCSAF